MDERRPHPAKAAVAAVPAQIAKAALRHLALAKLEPTPENYARAYAAESGGGDSTLPPGMLDGALPERAQTLLTRLLAVALPDAQPRLEISNSVREARWDEALRRLERALHGEGASSQAELLAKTIERVVRGLERGGRQWTVARKKDGLQRVLKSNRSDAQQLIVRLGQLVNSWESDVADASIATSADEASEGTPSQFFTEDEPAVSRPASLDTLAGLGAKDSQALANWPRVEGSLHGTVQHALRAPEARAQELIAELAAAQAELLEQGPDAQRAAQMEALCERARRLLDHRQHLFGELGTLCRELTASLVDLSEDDSWAHGQCEAMNQMLEQGLSPRGVRGVNEMLAGTRARQRSLREERSKARESLKSLINRMLQELGELGEQTGRFHDSVGRYADVIEQADSLESLAGVVREMVEESRTVQALVHRTQERLHAEHEKADSLNRRVRELEDELRRLSDEVHTDQLTQIANRRGLVAAFATEQAKQEREGAPLALALLDVDNFKKLNDTLGHQAGDVALQSLAARVSESLRPGDMVARYGGEEFVLMLPRTPLDEAQQVLTRLQRALSASLFMHEGRDVFVTFSAGVTLYRPGERLEEALDRADEALYVAKHTGKNRAVTAD